MLTTTFAARSFRRTLTLFALGLWAIGCTHNPDGPTPDMATPADASVLTPAQRGEQVVAKYHCGTCHNPENMADGVLSGQMQPRPMTQVYGANLTPDKDTGIGDWADDDIIRAVLTGIDDEMAELCPTMPRFNTRGMTDNEAHDLVAYLRSLKPVKRMIPESTCPPIKPMPMDGGTMDAH